MLKQLSSRLAPRLLLQGELAAFHTSTAAYGVGIPERKQSQQSLGLHEGEGGRGRLSCSSLSDRCIFSQSGNLEDIVLLSGAAEHPSTLPSLPPPPLLTTAADSRNAPPVCLPSSLSAGLQRSGADLSPKEYATSQREAPKDLAGVLDESANTLFLTELWRGLALTLKIFFEPPVTVRGTAAAYGNGQWQPFYTEAPCGLPLITLPLTTLHLPLHPAAPLCPADQLPL